MYKPLSITQFEDEAICQRIYWIGDLAIWYDFVLYGYDNPSPFQLRLNGDVIFSSSSLKDVVDEFNKEVIKQA